MTDNKVRARIRLNLRKMFQDEPAKLRNRRRKDVPDGVIDAYYTKRLESLRAEGSDIDRVTEIKACVEACNCTWPLARAGWLRQFPIDLSKPHRGGRSKRLR